MSQTELTKKFLDKTVPLVFDRDKSFYKVQVRSFVKELLNQFVPKTRYEATKQSRDKWEAKYKKLYKEHSKIKRAQEILGLVGKIK